MERIYLSSPHMGDLEKKYISEAFDTNWIAPLGPNVDCFERELADYIGIKNSVAVSSATAGIHMALKALGVGKGDKVFCSDLTFIASCNPIIYLGAEPIFIDSEKDTLNMSYKALERALKEVHPKAIVVVNLYGQSADYDKIINLCNEYNIPVVEDAAESLGGSYKGQKSGTLGDIGVFSFNGNKIITTSGGGMVVSSKKEYIDKIKFWITQAKEKENYYQHKEIGYNYRMSNILAGVGRGQLRVLEERIEKKRYIFNCYKEGFNDIEEISMESISQNGESNYWLSILFLKDRCKTAPIDIVNKLEEENIEGRLIWKPMHMQPVFKNAKYYKEDEFGESVSEKIFTNGLCLPSDTKMSDEDIDRVIKVIRGMFRDYESL